MPNFQPLVDYVTRLNWQVDINDDDWVQVTFNKNVYFTVNGPGYWSDDDPRWGVTIFTDAGVQKFEQSGNFDELPDLIRWIDKRLNPSEHDLNEAWGV